MKVNDCERERVVILDYMGMLLVLERCFRGALLLQVVCAPTSSSPPGHSVVRGQARSRSKKLSEYAAGNQAARGMECFCPMPGRLWDWYPVPKVPRVFRLQKRMRTQLTLRRRAEHVRTWSADPRHTAGASGGAATVPTARRAAHAAPLAWS
jgi:hypothetical protein